VDGTVGHAVTRSQAKRDHRVKPLKATPSTIENVTPDELSHLQKEDEMFRSWYENAESKVTESQGQETIFELKNGLLWRVLEKIRKGE